MENCLYSKEHGESCAAQEVTNANIEEVGTHIPFLGLTFESYDEAYDHYNLYARNIGFSIRKQRLDKNKRSGLILRREFCCNREGDYTKKSTPNKKRDSTRCGCNAMLEVKFRGAKEIVVTKFVDEHNHDLVPLSSSHLLRSQREIDPSQKKLITTMHESGLSQSQIFSYFSTQAGGPQNLNFIQTDCNNFVQKNRVQFLKRGDVLCLNEYFEKKKREDNLFFSAYRTNMENELTGFFFCDAKSKRDYAMFGDVMCFDTTFNTNKYSLLCASVIGINNHGQTVLFGCGVIDGESEDGCMWLFNTFLEAMGGKKPITIFTDQSAGISSAISKVFPETHHKLCLWHIYQNAGKNLSHVYGDSKKFSKDFKSCIYDPETIEEFDSKWEVLLENYDLRDNTWLKGIYNLRDKWAQVYARSHFCAGVTTTQRSESINKLLKTYFGRKLALREFVVQYDKAMINRREKERIADVMTKQTSPNLISTWKVEGEASKKYTRKIFKIFQIELGKLVDLRLDFESADDTTMMYRVVNLAFYTVRSVIYTPSDQSVSCSCRMFEFQGILCAHSLKVLRELNLKTLSSKYYLNRWTTEISNEVVFDSYGQVVVWDHDPNYLARYSELSHLSQDIVAKSSRADHLYSFVKTGLIEMKEKLKELAISEQEDQEACDEVNLETIPKGPKLHKFKGRKGRIKNALEIQPPKTKVLSIKKDDNVRASFPEASSSLYAPNQGMLSLNFNLSQHGSHGIGGQNGYPLRPTMLMPTLDNSHNIYSQGHVRQLHFLDESMSQAQSQDTLLPFFR